MKKIIIILFCFIIVSCNKENSTSPADEVNDTIIAEIDLNYLYNSWTHSMEEESFGNITNIFRPSSYKDFSPSRYREVLIFNQSQSCRYLVLAPNDGHYFDNGKWVVVDQKNNIFAILDSTEAVYKKFQITELKEDLLKYILIY